MLRRKNAFLAVRVLLIIALLLTSLLYFGHSIQGVKAEPYFSDNFNDGVADGWTQQLGLWAVTNGKYRVSVGIVENGISTVNGLNLTDCTIETKLRFTDSVGFRSGIAFRYLDTEHYYAFELSNEYDCLVLVRYTPEDMGYTVNSFVNYTVNNSFPIQTNTDYVLKVIVQGNSFRCFVNGQEVLSGTDNTYTYGEVGLRARRADVDFDNFKVYSSNPQTTPTPLPTPSPSPVPIEPNQSLQSYSDDFSTDSGLWQYLGNAYRDQTNQYLVLTEPTYEQGGVAFFDVPLKSSFTANFSYKVGGGSGGDGFTMFFYKQNYSTIGKGGGLGFNYEEIVPGYGIEFDGWQNIAGGQPSPPKEHGDPSPNHIALIEDHVGNHLIYVNDQRTEDNNWHKVSIDVQESSVRVFVDQGLILQWNGTLNKAYDGFGFSGATGRSGTNWHLIDNFAITFHTLQKPLLSASCRSSASYSNFNVEIKGSLTFNGTGLSGAPILLSYSVTGGKSWEDLTLVYTGSDGSYSAVWMPSVTGNYLLRAIWEGNDNYSDASVTVNFAVAPFEEQSIFSVTSNSTVSEFSFNSTSRELRFGVSGESGTMGYVNVYIPKSLINDISSLKVYLDGNQIEYTAESQSDCWLLYFAYQHSAHKVTINLGSSAELDGNPLGNWIIYVVIAAIMVIIIIAVFAQRRMKTKKQT